MLSIYYRAFNYIDSSKPSHLGIYVSLFLHLLILLFAIGLPDFFKSKKIFIPQVIPIEILNISDLTSLTIKKENLEVNKKKINIKQKKFNSSNNTEIQKTDLQEKNKKNITKNENISDNTLFNQKLDPKDIFLKEKKINEVKNKKNMQFDNVETLKVNKIKPKLKPKPVEKIKVKSDIKIDDSKKPKIKNENEKQITGKPKLIQKPNPDFNLATMLKDLRNEDILTKSEKNNKQNKKLEDIKEDNQKANLEVSISEMDLVLQQLRGCFNPRAGTQIVGSEMVKISTKMDKQASVRKDTVQIIDTNISKSNPYYESITESAVATLYNPLCSKLMLPLDKYESWKDLKITIDYSWIKN